jgi:hypothetical protein
MFGSISRGIPFIYLVNEPYNYVIKIRVYPYFLLAIIRVYPYILDLFSDLDL